MLSNWPKIGIVVPAYNEATRLLVVDIVHFLSQFPRISFCFVNDGSSDNTQQVLENVAKNRTNQVAVINLECNKGKAEAVRTGIKHILSWQSFDFVGYWDADMSTPLNEIPRFVEILNDPSPVQFVCGSRIRRMGAVIDRVWYRHYIGRIFATTAGLVLGLPVYDTQCGAKMMKVALAGRVFDKPFLTRWLFDVELFARALISLGEEQAKQAVFELPLEYWRDMEGSKLTLCYCARIPYELVKIAWRYRRKKKSSCSCPMP